MNLRLTDLAIRGVCRELLRTRDNVSGRDVRAELRARFGASGKTERVFRIWRSELQQCRVPLAQATDATVLPPAADLQARLDEAERRAAEHLARALRAEEREESHQSRWAMEIDRLRELLRQQPNYERELKLLRARVTELTVALSVLQDRGS